MVYWENGSYSMNKPITKITAEATHTLFALAFISIMNLTCSDKKNTDTETTQTKPDSSQDENVHFQGDNPLYEHVNVSKRCLLKYQYAKLPRSGTTACWLKGALQKQIFTSETMGSEKEHLWRNRSGLIRQSQFGWVVAALPTWLIAAHSRADIKTLTKCLTRNVFLFRNIWISISLSSSDSQPFLAHGPSFWKKYAMYHFAMLTLHEN